jgi:hypothetical protein
MYQYEELPVIPVLHEEYVRLPLNVLLALPEYVTRTPTVPMFNVPGAINSLMDSSGLERAVKVMNPHVWAPGWSATQLRSFVTAPFGDNQRRFPARGLRGLRAKEFPGTRGRVDMNNWQIPEYDIVHVLGSFGIASRYHSEPILRLSFAGGFVKRDDFVKGRALTAGVLRDALVAAKTRLLILQVAQYGPAHAERMAHFIMNSSWPAVQMARFIVGSGVPAVLVVAGGDDNSLDKYFHQLYANIIHNQYLDEVAKPIPDSEFTNLSAQLFYGQDGRETLRFDRWFAELNQRINHFENLSRRAGETITQELARAGQYLHRAQVGQVTTRLLPKIEGEALPLKTILEDLNKMRINIDFAHETGGVIPLTQIAGAMPQLDAAMTTMESEYPTLQEQLETEVNEMIRSAPRLLNAAFADPQTRLPLEPHQALVAERDYDLMVDVGPRWNTIKSLVTGNADFPEAALPPDQEGYLIKVVLISDDFQISGDVTVFANDGEETIAADPAPTDNSFQLVDIEPAPNAEQSPSFTTEFMPCLISKMIWVPRNTGRSFPVIGGKRADQASPVLLRLRAPTFPENSDEQFITARGRLCLYYENNLLQSAAVKVSIVPTADQIEVEMANEIAVDFALTGSFQNVEQFATRTLQTADGQGINTAVALNITLNDDGAGGHRIIVENHKELTVWRPYDPAAAQAALELTRRKLKECFWLKNNKTCDIDEGNEANRKDGLEADNGKLLRQFKCDLYWLALNGSELYTQVLNQLNLPNWTQWVASFRKSMAMKTVIQVARTSLAQYVFPWGLIYDIPLPNRDISGKLRWCDVLQEWSDPGGKRLLVPADACPYQDQSEHKQDTLCPYGFWGLKHYIEQPINLQPKMDEADANGSSRLLRSVLSEIQTGPVLDLAVGVTRDTALDSVKINTHLDRIKSISAYAPVNGADDWEKVQAMLKAPEIVYFLCHGEFDPGRNQPYLGVGLRDNNYSHRIYPKALTDWAITMGETFWQDRNPLIFINGCHTSNLKPGEILNFVTTFANLGASGVIGTEVSIRLPLAAEIAEQLLQKLTAGAAVGEAMRQIRWSLANKGNLLGLAYTPYCMTDLHIKRLAP